MVGSFQHCRGDGQEICSHSRWRRCHCVFPCCPCSRISRQVETQFSAIFYSFSAHNSGKSNFLGLPMAPKDPWLAEELCRGASLSPLMFSGEQIVAGWWLCCKRPETALISAKDEIEWTNWGHGAAGTICHFTHSSQQRGTVQLKCWAVHIPSINKLLK